MKHPFHEKLVRKKLLHRGRAVSFWVDTVRLSTGLEATREYMGHPGAVGVVPILTEQGMASRVVLVRQYRHPVGELTLELPAGKLDKKEKLLPCVRRELEEETGYRAKRIEKLMSFWPTCAFSDEVIYLYTARGLHKGRFRPDDDELIEPVILPLSETLRLIKTGRIKDSKTIIGLLAYAQAL